jgi:hypothetical protein
MAARAIYRTTAIDLPIHASSRGDTNARRANSDAGSDADTGRARTNAWRDANAGRAHVSRRRPDAALRHAHCPAINLGLGRSRTQR